jgi:DNA-binding response OmpR family regulator
MRILVVDDDLPTARMISFILGEEGYNVDTVDNLRGARAMVEKQPPDLLILDVNVPGGSSGFDFYRHLRELEYDIPVIFVTAKHELEDRLKGLRMGADDYIAKPFQPAELLARAEAVLRRYRKTTPGANQIVRGGGVEVSTSELRVSLPDQRQVFLTPTEMKVLLQLVRNAGHIVSRDDLLSTVWGQDYLGESNIVDVYIRRLRRKIERDPSNPEYIQATRGLGYRFAGK